MSQTIYELDLPARFGYTAGMNSTQYTIRYVPDHVDKALRKLARESGKSLNETTVAALEKATGTSAKDQKFHDLDRFCGIGIGDYEAFEEAMNWLDSLPLDDGFKKA